MSGSLTVSGSTIPFLVSNADEGFFSDSAIINEEELMSPGVDGARWRTVYKQFADFELRTVSQATTVAAAITTKRTAERKFVGKNVTLQAAVNGVTYTMKNVHVKAVKATVIPGPLYGAGVSSANAHVIIQWILHGTDFNSQ